jgi:hypothetical protein
MGLFLVRKQGERITHIIPPSDKETRIELTVDQISSRNIAPRGQKPDWQRKVKITYNAPPEVRILRNELLNQDNADESDSEQSVASGD